MKEENEVLSTYMQATGSNVQIFDYNSQPCEQEGSFNIEQNICRSCMGFSCGGNNCNGNCHGNCHGNCREMHANKIREASRNGRSLIYQCDLGLMFWISPIYDEGKFSGALRGSGFRNCGVNGSGGAGISISEKYYDGCGEAVSPKEFEQRILAFPPGDEEKIKSLSEMLHLCAETLSTGNENYHEILSLRFEQQASLSALIDDLKTKYPKGSGFPVYPLEKERQLVTLLRRGNKREAEKLLDELLSVIIFCNQDHFRYIQLRTIELAVLLARVGANSVGGLENKTRYVKQIQEAKTVEELVAILHSMVESIVVQIVLFQGIPHAAAMRKAESFIKGNFTRKISLREVAKIAGLSAPYFSTIFKEEMGENLSKYINRQRVEKASRMLLETDISLSEISNACCFDDQSWFSKIFKSFTGISPSKYRSQGGKINIA
jgi:AraC-like DNA-binding protein